MKKKRKISYLTILVSLTILLLSLIGCSFSTENEIPIPTVEENIYVYDQDNIIDDDVESSLNEMLTELEEKTEVEFAVVSVESLLNKSIEDYSNNLFNTLGIGKKGKDNGLLLIFSRSDERVRIEVGRGLEGLLNDAKCGRILDDYFVPYRENDEYTEATKLTVNAILNIFAEEYEVDINGMETDSPSKNSSDDELPLWVWIIIIILIIIIVAYFDGDIFIGGGSFGGSSGGFSGGSFGGGFSGGGGASR